MEGDKGERELEIERESRGGAICKKHRKRL